MPPKQPVPAPTATTKFDFLAKVLVTTVIRNKAGVEEKKVLETVFQMDALAAEKPWFVLRNFLVPKFLNKTIGPEGAAWVKIYEIKILKLVNRANPSEVDGIPLRVMAMDQLAAYCKKWEYPIKPEMFHSVEVARQYIALFEEDPKGYEKQYADYLAGGARKYPEMDEIRRNSDKYLGNPEELASEFDSLGKTPTGQVSPAVETEAPAAVIPQEETQAPTENKPAASRKAQIKADKLKAKREAVAEKPVEDPAPAEEPATESDPFSAV